MVRILLCKEMEEIEHFRSAQGIYGGNELLFVESNLSRAVSCFTEKRPVEKSSRAASSI